MPPPPKLSPTTGNAVPDNFLHSSGIHFQDNHGRSVLLRGVNLSGAAKCPRGHPSQSQEGFWSDAEAGQIDWRGCTFNLEDGSADVHLARLRAWGFNILRFVFTWEALESKGPGKYDHEYMDYVVKCLYKIKEYGFRVYMDPHQDVWSRFSGGSGAPLWTFYACGIDPQKIVSTDSAIVHSDYPSREHSDPGSMIPMIWASNYYRAANYTVWTMFYGGKEYAPKCIIDGVNIQDWLQDHFHNAVTALAQTIAKHDGLLDDVVIGWDSINEPGEGFIGIEDLGVLPDDQPLRMGNSPCPFECLKAGQGIPTEVPVYKFGSIGPQQIGKQVLNPDGHLLWLLPEDEATRGGGKWGWKRDPGWKMGTCIWAEHGVWDIKTQTLLEPTYFHTLRSDKTRVVSFIPDFWRYQWISYAKEIRKYHPESIHFMNATVFKSIPKLPEELLQGRACNSAHFYDGLTLMTKHWNWFNADAIGLLRGKYWSPVQALRIGEPSIRKCMQDQLEILMQDTKDNLGEYPTLIGELGCPYNMDGKKSYYGEPKDIGDYTSQQRAWDATLNGCDGKNVLNYSMWTYVPDNTHKWGDNWNGEDLSLYSKDDLVNKEVVYKDLGSTESVPETAKLADSVASAQTLVGTFTPKAIASGAGVTAELILDGARAPAAFCRPYPIATVGIPERLDFDIYSATFKLEVTVSPDDTMQGGATEIYVPFVHFAGNLDWPPKDGNDTPPGLLELGIDVKASVGTWTTSGQVLRWAYPIPSRPTKYTIEIRRVGGAMKHNIVRPAPTMFGAIYGWLSSWVWPVQ